MRIIAHRGGAGLGKENTLSCISEGLKYNPSMIEIDVHLTSDCEVVVCHDPDIDRTTDSKGLISEMTLQEVKAAHIVDADGNATPVVADLAEDYDGVLSGTNTGLSTTMKVREDRFTLVDGGYVKKGNYRIVIPTGTVLMQPNRSGLEKVYNDTEFVLNFVIDNDYEETTTPVEVDSYYTTNPEDGSKVAEIRNVVITFDDATAITLAELGETPDPIAWPFCNKVLEVEDFGTQTSPIAPMACSVEGNALTLSIVANDYTDSLDYISALGNYTITIPAGWSMAAHRTRL